MDLLGTVDWSGRIYSGGWVAGDGGTYQSVEPATGRTLAQVGAASTADLDRAVDLAGRAQPSWAASSYSQRAAVLRRAADLLEAHHSEIEDWSMREAGVPRYWAGVDGPAEECGRPLPWPATPAARFFPPPNPGCPSPAGFRLALWASLHRSTLR